MNKIKTVVVGCGNIANTYAEQISKYNQIELAGFCDLQPGRAVEFARKHGGKAYRSLDEALEDASIALVINLTIHHAHFEVISRCLEAGKHVHTEKPLATSGAEARQLVALAERKGLRLSSAPSVFLSEPIQTLARELRAGRAGTLRLLYAEQNQGRIETWHPNPEPFYKVGPLWDIAVYPLGIWAVTCGPMRKVTAVGKSLLRERQTKDGRPFTIGASDFYTALIEFENGVLGRLTSNFYVRPSKQAGSMEFHGDDGSLFLENLNFDTPVEFAPFGGAFAPLPLVRNGSSGVEFARGVEDLADAILNNRPHRCDARVAQHVVEVIEAIHLSAETGKSATITSTFDIPEPMPWAR